MPLLRWMFQRGGIREHEARKPVVLMFSPWSFDLASRQLSLISMFVDDYWGKWVVRHRSYLSFSLQKPTSDADQHDKAVFILPTSLLFELLQLYSNGVMWCQHLQAVARKLPPSPFCCGWLVCSPFVWELIISAMVATWNIWRGINSCLLSLPTSEGQIRRDSPWPDCSPEFLTILVRYFPAVPLQ